MNRNVVIFMIILAFAGLMHVVDNLVSPRFLSSFLFLLVTVIYFGLIFFWMISLQIRLLPNRARTYSILAAVCMLLMILIRTVKYRLFFETTPQARYLWFGSYLPMMMIPMLFALSCREYSLKSGKRGVFYMLTLPVVLLMVLMLTNDLHHLFFHPLSSGEISVDGSYGYGICFYLMYAVIAAEFVYGLFVMFRSFAISRSRKSILFLVLSVLLYLLLQVLRGVFSSYGIKKPFEVYEIHVFSMMLIWEICIQQRLIPHNIHYQEFYESMSLPMLITDRIFQPRYSTVWNLNAGPKELLGALKEPVYIEGTNKLAGKSATGGYVFWTEDQSDIFLMNQQLSEIGETLEQENDLIRAENELAEKQERVAYRARIYSRVAAELLPAQQKIQQILDSADVSSADFDRKIAMVSILNAYVKRKTNLFLLAGEHPRMDHRELQLALEESARYVRKTGTAISVDYRVRGEMSSKMALCLYDTFETVLESLLDQTSQMMVVLTEDMLRISCGVEELIKVPQTPLPTEALLEDHILFITARGSGGWRADP